MKFSCAVQSWSVISTVCHNANMNSSDVSSARSASVSIAEGTTCQDNVIHHMQLFILSITSILSL